MTRHVTYAEVMGIVLLALIVASIFRGGSVAAARRDILKYLSNGISTFSGAQLTKMTEHDAGDVYLALYQLESEGLIESAWAEGAYPRRRLYRIAPALDARESGR